MEENDKKLEALGFEIVRAGQRRYFRTPKPNRRHLHKMTEVVPFLEAEKQKGRLLNVSEDLFVFNLSKKQRDVRCEDGEGTPDKRYALQLGNEEGAHREHVEEPVVQSMVTDTSCADEVGAPDEGYALQSREKTDGAHLEPLDDPELASIVQTMVKLLQQQPGAQVNHRLVNKSTRLKTK